MALIKKDGNFMGLPMNIQRGNPIPLDDSSVYYDRTTMENYAKTGVTAYVGQIITLVNETDKTCEAYMISNEAGNLVKLAQTTASGDLAADVATLQSQVSSLIETVGADDTSGLQKAVKDNATAITKLNSDNTTEGSVDYKIKRAIDGVLDGAPETFDTLKEISAWIEKHGTEATNMTTAIGKLEAIVDGIGGEGEEATVVAYVTSAINALKNGDIKQAKDDLDSLAGRVDGHDTKLGELETAIGNVKTTAEAAVEANTAITAGTATKITYDAKGLVTKGENLAVSDIPTLGISKIDGLQDALNGKQDELTFDGTYNSGTNKAATVATVNTAVDNLIHTIGGEDGQTDVDTKDSNTIHGAKLYADQVLKDAKNYADGIVTGESGISKKVEALEAKHADGKTVAQEVQAGIDALKLVENFASKSAFDSHDANGVKHITADERTKWNKAVDDVATLNGEESAAGSVKAIAKEYADKKDAAIKAAKDAADNLSTKVGAVPADKTIVQMIEDAKTEATYDDTTVKADIKKNADAIGILNGTETVEGSVKKTVNDAINDFATKISEDGTVNTFKELVDYVAEHGSQYTDAIADIAANKSAIGTLNGTGAGSVKKTVDDAISALNIDDYAKSADVESTYVKKETGKSLISDDLITKLTNIDTEALSNKIEKITVNGTEQTITSKTVALESYKGDGTSIENDAINHTLSIKAVSTDLLKQGTDELILNGGTAANL